MVNYEIKLICCISLDYDLDLIPHFCNHYSQYDINSYHFILNKKNSFHIVDYLEYFTKLHPTEINFELWVGEFNAIDKIDKFNKIIQSSKESHILLTDVDEFQNHDEIKQNYIWGDLVDREPKNSDIKKITSEDIKFQFPIKSKISGWKNTIKPCVFPSTERLKTSHYITTEYKGEPLIQVDHYRWTNTRLIKSKNRYDVYTKLNIEGKKFKSGYGLDTTESKFIIKRLTPKNNI
jgi:hypothetical protein